jgi:hypothetical protein
VPSLLLDIRKLLEHRERPMEFFSFTLPASSNQYQSLSLALFFFWVFKFGFQGEKEEEKDLPMLAPLPPAYNLLSRHLPLLLPLPAALYPGRHTIPVPMWLICPLETISNPGFSSVIAVPLTVCLCH